MHLSARQDTRYVAQKIKPKTKQFPSVFKFTLDENIRKVWISKVPRQNWEAEKQKHLYLCEKHFKDSDFDNDLHDKRKRKERNSDGIRKKRKLRDDAIPSVWPNLPSHS